MSHDALAFEKEWGIRVRENTEFLRNWARAILAIDHTQEDAAHVMEHYHQWETAWRAINAVPEPIATQGKVAVLMPPSEAEWDTDRAQLSILTRWGDIYQAQGDWNAAAATYLRAATDTYVRPMGHDKVPSPDWVRLLASWQRLLSTWGGVLQQAGDPLHAVSESVLAFREQNKNCPKNIFYVIDEDQIRFKSEKQYAAFLASYQEFEPSFKLYTRHWLNCFQIEVPEGEHSDFRYTLAWQSIEEDGEPALATMYKKLAATYRSVKYGFEPEPPVAEPAVWRGTSKTRIPLGEGEGDGRSVWRQPAK